MKRHLFAIVTSWTLLSPVVTWAGVGVGRAIPHAAPAVDESGLMLLGVGLVGAGFALLRRRGK